jgi:hypothetical protein
MAEKRAATGEVAAGNLFSLSDDADDRHLHYTRFRKTVKSGACALPSRGEES